MWAIVCKISRIAADSELLKKSINSAVECAMVWGFVWDQHMHIYVLYTFRLSLMIVFIVDVLN